MKKNQDNEKEKKLNNVDSMEDGFDYELERRLEEVRKIREENNRKLSQMTEEEMYEYEEIDTLPENL